MNSIVVISASKFLRLFNLQSLADNILAFALLFCSQVILTELILGLLSALTISSLVILNSLICLVAIFFIRKRLFFDGLRFSFKTDSLSNKIIVFAVSCIVGFGMVKIFVNLVNPPFGWDSINYHFTFPVEWIKHANLVNPITINDDPSPTYFPMNGSLWFLWLIFPFKDVFLADLGQLPFFILCLIATYSIARKIGINKDYAFLCAALFVMIPNFFKQLEIAYVDIMLAAFFLIATNFLLLLNEHFSLENALIAAVGFGLFLGTKTIAIPFGAILFIFFLLVVVRQNNYKKVVFCSISSCVIFILLGGFSYIRNFFLTGNLLYPANIRIFGKMIMKGVLDISYYKAHYVPRDYSLEKLLFHEGLGLQTIILVLPALFLALPISLLKNKSKTNIVFVYLLIMPLLLYLAFRYVIPLAASRYLYSALGIGLVIAFLSLQVLKTNRRVVYGLTLICIIFSLPELVRKSQLVYSFLLTGLIFGLTFMNFKKLRLGRGTKLAIFSFSAFLFILGLGFLQKDYLRNEFGRYIKPVMAKAPFWPDAARAWLWLNNHTESSRIAYVGRPVPFPLYGRRFKNEVYYVSVNKGKPYLHAYPKGRYQRKKEYITLHRNLEEPGNYREYADYSVWLSNLLRHNTDYLFVYSLHQTKEIEFPMEDKWALANPAKFAPVFTNETIHIYKIVGSR